MKTVDAKDFLNARTSLDPAGLIAFPEAYEALWLAEESPYNGQVNRLVFEDDQGVAVRLVVLQPSDGGEALFCFYGRRENLAAPMLDSFFQSLNEWLMARGITSLQGPIEFSTWHSYRFVCKQGPSPWFAGEQPMPDYCFTDFSSAGFQECARFASTLLQDLDKSIDLALTMGVDKKLGELSIEMVTGNDILEILPTLYDLSKIIFQDNYAYSPITYEEFHALYTGIMSLDAVVIVAKKNQIPVALTFSYNIGPYASIDEEEPKLTAVFKTFGVHPDSRNRHIGFGIGYLTHKFWLERGVKQIIHAYMKSDNASLAMSSHFGRTIREYALLRWSAPQ